MLSLVRFIPALLILIGGLGIWAGWSRLLEGRDNDKWPHVQGRITQVEVAKLAGKDSSRPLLYFPEVTYEYVIDGHSYSGKRVSFETRQARAVSTNWEQAMATASAYESGQSVPVYYNPANPSSSVLKPAPIKEAYETAATGLQLLVLGVVLMLLKAFVSRFWARSQKRTIADGGGHDQPPGAAQYKPSRELLDFMYDAMEHAFGSLRDGAESFHPFAFLEVKGERLLRRFMLEENELATRAAFQVIEQDGSEATKYAVAYDGFVTIDGSRTEAVFVEAGERGQPSGILFCLRYRSVDKAGSQSDSNPREAIGDPMFVGTPKLRLS